MASRPCPVVGCPEDVAPGLEFCQPHAVAWAGERARYGGGLDPWHYTLVFERFCVQEGRRLRLKRVLDGSEY